MGTAAQKVTNDGRRMSIAGGRRTCPEIDAAWHTGQVAGSSGAGRFEGARDEPCFAEVADETPLGRCTCAPMTIPCQLSRSIAASSRNCRTGIQHRLVREGPVICGMLCYAVSLCKSFAATPKPHKALYL